MGRHWIGFVLAAVLQVEAATFKWGKVDYAVYQRLFMEGTANILVEHGGTKTGLEMAQDIIDHKKNCIPSREVRNSLQGQATESQACVDRVLARRFLTSQSFWITNVMHVNHATFLAVTEIAACEQVSRLILEPIVKVQGEFGREMLESRQQASTPTWGISKVGAPNVWAQGYQGQGVVVGTIDTGVMHTHEALAGKWRSDHGWYDPVFKSPMPYDKSGHGTHVMGTILGSFGIGMAPNASFITCLGCANGICTGNAILACAQFLLCPTNSSGGDANCTLHPHVINNSWGGRGDYSWFEGSIKAWRMAGIIPVFPIGNSGPSCATTNSPGSSTQVIGVGATGNGGFTTGTDALAYFSSRGGGLSIGRVKPDIAAPGYFVLSSVISTNSSYEYWAGTSMASPHVAGAVALFLSRNLLASYDEVFRALTTSTDTFGLVPTQQNCGRVFDFAYPNNNYGSGRLNIARAFLISRVLEDLPDF